AGRHVREFEEAMTLLKKRAKGKKGQDTDLGFRRLLEDQYAYEALEWERTAALDECQRLTEEMAILADAARRAGEFDRHLRHLLSQIREATPEECRTLADGQTLKKLAKEQAEGEAEACAQCEALAARGGEMKEAWRLLSLTWASMKITSRPDSTSRTYADAAPKKASSSSS
ncbi:unnamed protein product, partial [Symbiodinium sp. CCMP2592]